MPIDPTPEPGLVSWLYTSVCTVPAEALPAAVDDIVAVSQAWNRDRGLTGALISTGDHFAQYLEGGPDAVEATRAKILTDRRHRDVLTIEEVPVAARRFGGWWLAYAGADESFDRLVSWSRELNPESARVLLLEMLTRFGRSG